jgi:Zn-dependent metalloprotease
LSEQQALDFALDFIQADMYMWEERQNNLFSINEKGKSGINFYPHGELKISANYNELRAKNFKLVYRFDIYVKEPFSRYYIDVDANTGEIINLISKLHCTDIGASGITLYNNVVKFTADSFSNGYRLREARRGEGIQTFDLSFDTHSSGARDIVDDDTIFTDPEMRAGVSVHWATEVVFDYFFSLHGRNSYDDKGSILYSYVRYGRNFNNAAWDGRRLIYGNGDSENFTPFVSLDLVAHEFTHAVTQSSADLFYQNESGAINEAFSDIFGTIIEFYNDPIRGDWYIGEDICLNQFALRSMKDPNSLNHPDTYKGNYWYPQEEFPDRENDFGGIHTNCGVLNYWFYLLSEGGFGTNDFEHSYSVYGIGIHEAIQIVYRTLTTYLMPYSGFLEAKKGSIHSTVDLFGENSPQYDAVVAAWEAVGVSIPYVKPTAVVSHDSLNFLAEVLSSRDTAEINIKNLSIKTLQISSCQVSHTDYSIESEFNYPVDLAYLERLVVKISYLPSAEGERTDTLHISTNDRDNPNKIVVLKGTGYKINPAIDDDIYTIAGSESNGALIYFDNKSFESSLVGATGFESPKGLSICPSNRILFSTIDKGDSTLFIQIDAKTGHTKVAGSIPLSNIRAIAFDMNDDIYALQADNGRLYVLSPDLKNVELVGTTNIQFPIGMTINPFTRKIWASSLLNDTLYTIDNNSGRSKAIGTTGLERTAGLTFDKTGTLIALSNYYINKITDLYYINPVTGEHSPIGSTEYKGVNGIVYSTGFGSEPVHGDSTGSGNEPIPDKCILYQNYPNPFNSRTTIRYFLAADGEVILRIYNLAGEEVRTLVNKKQAAGFKTTNWDGRNENGMRVSSGLYILTYLSENDLLSRKLLYLK